MQDVQRPVGRSPIHHDVLDAWVILAEDALDRFLQKAGRIVRRRDDTDQRQIHDLNCSASDRDLSRLARTPPFRSQLNVYAKGVRKRMLKCPYERWGELKG